MTLRNILLYILYVAVIVGLTIAIIEAFDNSSPEPPKQQPAGSSQPASPSKPSQTSQPSQPAKPSQNGNNSQSQSSGQQQGQSKSPKQPAASGSNLSNTGPGETLAVFLSTVFVSIIAYQWHMRRHIA
jgi:predicted lipid-binding transport protein (Tim44 family)